MTHFENGKVVKRYTGIVYNGDYWGTGILEIKDGDSWEVICGFFAENVLQGEGVKYNQDGEAVEQGEYEAGVLLHSYEIEAPISFPKSPIWEEL